MLSVGTWLVVDAALDNTISMEVESGGEGDVTARAQSLRERGWERNAGHPLAGQGPAGWPPRDAILGIELDKEDLAFVRGQIEDAVAGTVQLLSSAQLHPQVRTEQEQSLSGLEGARLELAQVVAP